MHHRKDLLHNILKTASFLQQAQAGGAYPPAPSVAMPNAPNAACPTYSQVQREHYHTLQVNACSS